MRPVTVACSNANGTVTLSSANATDRIPSVTAHSLNAGDHNVNVTAYSLNADDRIGNVSHAYGNVGDRSIDGGDRIATGALKPGGAQAEGRSAEQDEGIQ